MKKYTVKLSSAPNPDLGETKSPAPKIAYECDTISECQDACKEYISEYFLGSGNWRGGQIIENSTSIRVCRVAYNGKIVFA